MAPVFAPAGFGDWRISGALLTGVVAKEAVVTTLAQTHQADRTGQTRQADRAGQTPQAGRADGMDSRLTATMTRASGGHPGPAALALLMFVLAYTPCAATVATQRAEIGGRWTAVGVALQFSVAWLLATLVFQAGRLLA